jgi:ribosomal protein S18 acetylase RimI-like enzyme
VIVVEPRTTLVDAERATVMALINTLREDGVDPRIDVQIDGAEPRILLAHAAEQLVGMVTVNRFGDSAEAALALAVNAPAETGAALLAALPQIIGPGVTQLLVLNDRASNLAALYREHGFVADHSEQVLRLAAGTTITPLPGTLTVRSGTEADLATIAGLIAADWGVPHAVALAAVTRTIAYPHTTFYLALSDGQPVGTLNVQRLEGRPWIYGFSVGEQHRGQGYGRQIITRVLAELIAQDPGDIFLEVDETNQTAQNLYRSLGFETVRTYDYWERRGS